MSQDKKPVGVMPAARAHDVYTQAAASFYGISRENVTDAMRREAKERLYLSTYAVTPEDIEDAVRECGCGSGLHPTVCHERPEAP